MIKILLSRTTRNQIGSRLVLFPLKHGGCSHARADAHTDYTKTLVCPLKIGHEARNHSCTCHAKWMPKCDRTAVRVDFVHRNAKLLHAVNGLACKCLINFENIYVLLGETRCLQDGGDCNSRADSHFVRLDANDLKAAVHTNNGHP